MTGEEVAALAGWTDPEDAAGGGPAGEDVRTETGDEPERCAKCGGLCPCLCDEEEMAAEADVLGIDAGDAP